MPDGPHLVQGSGGLKVGFRLYDAQGVVREQTLDIATLPSLDPVALLRMPAGPAYDVLAGLTPPLMAPDIPSNGAFGLIITPEQRWRVYVLPLGQDSTDAGYLETLTPLGRLDHSVRIYRLILFALGLAGLSAAPQELSVAGAVGGPSFCPRWHTRPSRIPGRTATAP
jgi:two-component system, OmpR family, sensor kinase